MFNKFNIHSYCSRCHYKPGIDIHGPITNWRTGTSMKFKHINKVKRIGRRRTVLFILIFFSFPLTLVILYWSFKILCNPCSLKFTFSEYSKIVSFL